MMTFTNYQRWLVDQVSKTQPTTESQFNFERGDIVSFMYSPKRGEGGKANDMFVLLLATEMRSGGQGRGVYGYNLYEIPGITNQDRIGQALNDGTVDNMEVAQALHRSRQTRQGFKLYLLDGIQSRVMKLDHNQLNRVLN